MYSSVNEKKEMSIRLNWSTFSRYENINKKVNLRLLDSYHLKNRLTINIVKSSLKNSDGKNYWKKILIVNLNLNITFILKLLSCLQEFSFK